MIKDQKKSNPCIQTFEGDKMIKKIKEKIKNFDFKAFKKNLKKTSKEYFQTNVLFTVFTLSSVINGCLLRFFTVGNYFAIRPILADLSVVLFIGAFGYFIKPKNQYTFMPVFSK